MKLLIAIILLTLSNSSYSGHNFTWYSMLPQWVQLPNHVLTYFLIAIILIMFSILYKIKIKNLKTTLYPDPNISLRNMIDLYTEFIMNLAIPILGKEESKKNFSFIASIFLVILICNLTGLIPGMIPPTEHISTTLALGLVSFSFYNLRGVINLGFLKYLKHMSGPVWYMAVLIFPIELISHLFRPLTLSLRLRGNIMGDHIVLATFNDVAPVFVPIFFMMLGVFVCVVQAYVFTVLSMVYISIAGHHEA